MAETGKILIIGAGGQIGTELTPALREKYGKKNVITADLNPLKSPHIDDSELHELLDVTDEPRLKEIVEKHEIKVVYLLAALLSATAEKKPEIAWDVNMKGLFNVLNLAVEKSDLQVFWPSSIAVFGPSSPHDKTPQHTITEPSSVYGISKLSGERWCEYYFEKFNVDVRSLRYPGLIGYTGKPGGGTTDYAVEIFHEALLSGSYTCFLSANTVLPMMYMPDAIRATIELMEAPAENIRIRSSYNLSGFSFSPSELAENIQQHLPEFKIDYKPDSRQIIAESWPNSIDDSRATEDWGWKPEYTVEEMTADMLEHLEDQLQQEGKFTSDYR